MGIADGLGFISKDDPETCNRNFVSLRRDGSLALQNLSKPDKMYIINKDDDPIATYAIKNDPIAMYAERTSRSTSGALFTIWLQFAAKIIRTLEIIRIKNLIPNVVL